MHQPLTWDIPLRTKPTVQALGETFGAAAHAERYQATAWGAYLFYGAVDVSINGVRCPVGPGHCVITAPGVRRDYQWENGQERHAFAYFLINNPSGPTINIPAAQPLDDAFADADRGFHRALAASAVSIERAEAWLWDFLWQLAERGGKAGFARAPKVHPAVDAVQQLVQLKLAQPLSVSALAAEINMTTVHLNRLFQTHLGTTVGQYIRRRRMERAHVLLLQTDLPIGGIACRVGIPNPQLFSKTVRHHFGISPQMLRERGISDAVKS